MMNSSLIATDELKGLDLHERLGCGGELPLRLLELGVGPEIELVLEGVTGCIGRIGASRRGGEHHGGLLVILAGGIQHRLGRVHHEIDRRRVLLLIAGAEISHQYVLEFSPAI